MSYRSTLFRFAAMSFVYTLGCSGSGTATSAGGGANGAGLGGSANTATTTNPPATGGSDNAGGAPAAGGIIATGGSQAETGGAPATGGLRATGSSKAAGGSQATGGVHATGGSPATGSSKAAGGSQATGGVHSTGGSGGGAASGGASSAASSGTAAVSTSGACTMGTWATADPSKAGPFATTTESNVGPQAGVGVDGGTPPQFTLFRPKDLAQGGLCHPLITWGNGHGTTPSIYSALLTRMASHGFVVIASNSSQVSQGSPAPMIAGLTWVLEQNSDPSSELYQRIDTTHIGATGHSEGAMATASAGGDSRVLTIAPICGGSNARNLHGPALFLCGGQDTTLPCSGSVTALNSVTSFPALVADYLTATHTSWMTFGNSTPSPMEVADLAWMRVQLMGDTSLRPMFYGASCTLCADTADWQITQNSLMSP